MKRNIVKSIAAIATVTLGFAFIAIPHKSNPQLTDVQLANIEALAQSESMLIECDNLSPIIKCKKMCMYCGTIWTTLQGYGNPGRLKGTCKCGVTYY